MVCVTITRKAGVVDDASVIKVRDALHLAIMEVLGVKFQDVNCGFAIKTDSTSIRVGWRSKSTLVQGRTSDG